MFARIGMNKIYPDSVLVIFWLVSLSALWIETDAYRVTIGLLALLAFIQYVRETPRLFPAFESWICFGWVAYVVTRFGYQYATLPGNPTGAAEGLYLMPLIFPTFGLAFTKMREAGKAEAVVLLFFVISLIFLIIGTDYMGILAGKPVSPMFHNNRIHGGVASGFLFIGAVMWLVHQFENHETPGPYARIALYVAPAVAVFSFVNVIGSWSKGVWVSLMLVLPLLAYAIQSISKKSAHKGTVWALAAMILLAVFAARHEIWKGAAPTIIAAASLSEKVMAGAEMAPTIEEATVTKAIPFSMKERLMIWSNAAELLAENPVFGSGVDWLRKWRETTYSERVEHTLLHSAYLEIIVRHGLFSVAVFAIILFGYVRYVRLAAEHGLISKSARACFLLMVAYFMLTMLSNSNNRLAIGESFFLLMAAFSLHCYEILTNKGLLKKPTLQ
jgi:O-antigen ligase